MQENGESINLVVEKGYKSKVGFVAVVLANPDGLPERNKDYDSKGDYKGFKGAIYHRIGL